MTRAGLTIAVVCLLGSAPGAQTPSLTELLDTYYQGGYDEAVARAAAIQDLGLMRLRIVRDQPRWIGTDPDTAAKRRAAAAAFLLELTRARLESDWGRLNDLVELTCVQLRAAGPPTPFELAWHRASIALAGRARARLWLLGEYAVLPHQKPRQRPDPKEPDPYPKHLMHGLERFPDDPHLKLARIVAWTWSRDAEPIRNQRGDEDAFERRLARRATPQEEAITALQALVDDPAVGDEALLRTGQMYFAMARQAEALRAFEQVQRKAQAPELRYLGFFLAGRTLEELQRVEPAKESYQQALGVLSDAESAAVALASLQFVSDGRERAVALMRKAFDAPAAATDPGRLVGYGSFMHWPALRAALRAELGR